jgi:DHA2 family lincomycin resistance protein-like MFS transporter
MLLTGRIIQALGTGLLIPVNMNITLDVAPREKLGAYMGIMGIMTTLGPSLSIILAGVLLSLFTWHSLLWIFACLCALCFASGAVILRNVAKLTHPRLDALSVVLVALALVGILYGISTVFEGNVLVTVGAVVIGACSLAGFAARQKRLEHPLIDLRALSVKPYVVGAVINMIAIVLIFALNIIIPIFLQGSLGSSPLGASLTLFPAIVLAAVVAPIAGRIYDKRGVKALAPLGFALIGVFVIILAYFAGTGSLMLMAVLYIPVICGSALIIGPIQSFALSKLTPELNAHGVTIISTGFQIGGCIGAAFFSGLYARTIGFAAASGLPEAAATNRGFLITSVILAVVALIGFILALRAGAYKTPAKILTTPSALSKILKRDVFTVHSEDTVLDALRAFVEKKVSGMPVVNNQGELSGFISDGDIMRYLADQHTAFKNAYSFIIESDNGKFDEKLSHLMQLPVSEIASKQVLSIDVNTNLGEVCRALVEHNLKKMPVLENGKMVGIINLSNITHYSVNSYLENHAKPNEGDNQ